MASTRASGARPTRLFALLIAVALPLIMAILIAFQNNLFRYAMDPRTPFQTTPAPAAPDYSSAESWAARPQRSNPVRAAVFVVHPTTYWGRSGWNAAIDAPRPRERLADGLLVAAAGPFQAIGEIWAPRYRQAALYTALTHRYDARRARALAYADVARAFEVFIAEAPPTAPLILVGVEQGGQHILGILQHALRNETTARRLAAAYVIDQASPLDLFEAGPLAHLTLCLTPEQTRCVVTWGAVRDGWEDEVERYRRRSLVWTDEGRLEPTAGRALACVNPISGVASEDFAPQRLNKGAVDARGLELGVKPAPMPDQTSAQCRDGVLLVDRSDALSLRMGWSWGGRFKPTPVNLFYADIEADAARRLSAHTALSAEESRRAPPLEGVITLDASPIHRVPEPE